MLDAALELEPVAAEAVEVDLELEPHAWSIIPTTPAAPPVRAARRVSWCHFLSLDSPWAYFSSSLFSSHSSRSTASWTRSSFASDIWGLLLFLNSRVRWRTVSDLSPAVQSN